MIGNKLKYILKITFPTAMKLQKPQSLFISDQTFHPNIPDQKGARKKAKASASQGIPELIQIAQNPRWEENKERKHIKDAKYGWYRYDIRFGIPVYDDKTGLLIRYNIFTAILLIKHSEDGKKYLHDITTIKKETSSPLEL